ncbi:hypothetical protein SAMN05446037_100211 [Anaerovirgula multivorans]|uniref:Uncharacterized protein n=1 Tax=Anaerovirgula multivorans TaxID=312168 RepID=A0A239AFY2_9FIRM|nr:hypothetical protein [Anaerovirgula multivorans]SNR94547.1 hypothetical protein SAMN05446037_100211 [Anaerovirgula multivorans]
MKEKIKFDDHQLDTKIKNLFTEATGNLKMDTAFRHKLLTISEEQRPLSPFSRFLEKEICLPVFSLPAFAVILMILIGISAHSFLLPENSPQPKYEIVEMNYGDLNMCISNRY